METCERCGECCKHVAVPIDKPEDNDDYHNILWYLYHEKVQVFVDDEDDWYIEFSTRCSALDKNNRCRVYDKRPNICREYSPESCVKHGEGEPYKYLFKTPDEFIKFLEKKKIKINFKS